MLIKAFSLLPDPRTGPAQHHDLKEMIVMTLCGSRDGANTALHMVSAFATQSGLCLGQEGTRGKGSEIVAIQRCWRRSCSRTAP